MIDLILGDALPYLITAGIAVLAFFGYGKVKKREGAKDNQAKQEEIDHENAADIRKRVDDVEPMHDDDLKFRN